MATGIPYAFVLLRIPAVLQGLPDQFRNATRSDFTFIRTEPAHHPADIPGPFDEYPNVAAIWRHHPGIFKIINNDLPGFPRWESHSGFFSFAFPLVAGFGGFGGAVPGICGDGALPSRKRLQV